MLKYFHIYIIAFFCTTYTTTGQNAYTCKFHITDKSNLDKNLKVRNSFNTQQEIKSELNNILVSLRNAGYLLASCDSIVCDSISCHAEITAGEIFKWAFLKQGNADDDVLSYAGYREKFFSNATFSPIQISRLFEKIISWYENNGYPFAKVKFDSVNIQDDGIKAVLNVQKNKLIKIDSFIIIGKASISKNFLTHYLHIFQGSDYNESNISQISQKMKQLPFLKEQQPAIVRMTSSHTRLLLFLDKKNASQFDGIIGLQPEPTGKTVLTGDVRLRLYNNVFKAGELIDLNWKRLQYQTQDLKFNFTYPYLFKTPVGTDYSLSIYRRDTTFIDIQNNIGLQYLFKGLNYIKVFYRQRNSNLLGTTSLQGLTALPDYADVATYAYGVGFYYEKFDYRFNPRKGILISGNGSAGNRIIRKNNNINPLLYNHLQLQSEQYQAEGMVNWFIPLFKQSTIKMGAQGGTIMSPNLFKNEMFRIGGFKTIRGIDEQSIYASSYGIGSFEYRFLFEMNSAFILFSDAAWYENNSNSSYLKDIPYCVGAGFSFETKAGIFQLNYALGSQFGSPLDFRTGKINFGLVKAL